MIGQSITRNGLLLGLFAIITTGVIAGTYLGTREAIRDNIRRAEAKALLEIIPEERHDNDLLDDTVPVGDRALLGLREEKPLYIARRAGKTVAMIVPVTARDGYTGDIELIVGINRDGTIAGVRVLQHRETPGLGDKVERRKSDWVESFVGKSLENPEPDDWAVKKDGGVFDQFTGATITPRAVTNAVFRALQYYRAHGESMLSEHTGESKQTDDQEIESG